jgi:hypothetical protein
MTKTERDMYEACIALREAIENDYLYNRFHDARIEKKGKTLYVIRGERKEIRR